ncbi:hypothetical protein [Polaribacter ponticola]|uniref:Uncharacterized protein n=1 Tax=Polaribacter ponticola TaxID=2978475 RepID=A0ABT5S983_9FLAO|nr:hypothetical protein [Polaribacter sp. MSW5]MDD7914682.1 hypothetical protein [Polaribacter sp. MSW5]
MSKWLLRKTSGSRAKHKTKGDFSNNRNGKSDDLEYLPKRESMQGKNAKNTFLDTGLVYRWLQSKVGENFDTVYSEFLTRIQPKYLDEYRNCIFYYLEPSKTVVFEDGITFGTLHDARVALPYGKKKLYVDPVSNLIKKV